MPYQQQLGGVLWALAVGLVMWVVIHMTVRSGWFRKGGNNIVPAEDVPPMVDEPVHRYADDFVEAHGPVPIILKIIIAGYLVFVVWYVYNFISLMNGPLAAFDKLMTQ